MRNYVIWCLTVLVFAAACGARADTRPSSKEEAKPPKELSLDLRGGINLELVFVPAGDFLMGKPDSDKDALGSEKPQHRVRITKPFYLGKYLVTQEQWQAVMGENPSKFKGPKNPVEQVSWDDCQRFVKKLGANITRPEGHFALPTEAQWEYACRAGSTTQYCFGDDESQLGDYAFYKKNSDGKSHPVGQKKPNAWDLYDMHGNVWEWCEDWYNNRYYSKSPTDDPVGPSAGSIRVIRGGSWACEARACRSAVRLFDTPRDRREFDLGFRVAIVP